MRVFAEQDFHGGSYSGQDLLNDLRRAQLLPFSTVFVMVTTAETRPFVRMIIERMFPTLPVLSQLEIARGIEVKSLGVVA